MQSRMDVPPAPKLMVTPTNHLGRFEVERDCRGPLLISRCPSMVAADVVERDMKRTTPTTPVSSSSGPFPSATHAATTVKKGSDHHGNSNRGALKARGLQRQVEGQHSGSSSSSLSSLSSPTENQESGGVADLTPQPRSESMDSRTGAMLLGPLGHGGHAPSAVAAGGKQTQGTGDGGTVYPLYPTNSRERRQDAPVGGHSGQLHIEDMSRQSGSWQRIEDHPTGHYAILRPSKWQRMDPRVQSIQPTRNIDPWHTGHSRPGMHEYQDELYEGHRYQAWQRHEDQPSGQQLDDQPGGQGEGTVHSHGICSGEDAFVGGQNYSHGQGEKAFAEGESTRHAPGTSTVSGPMTRPTPLYPSSSTLLRTPSYPPSYHKPVPPHGDPSSYHQRPFPCYTHHQPAPSAIYGGSGLVEGGWDHFSYGGHSSLESGQSGQTGSTGVPYYYLGGEGSRERLCSSSQPSSLQTMSETGRGYHTRLSHPSNVRPDTSYDQEERCHSSPLPSYHGGPQPPYQQYHRMVSSSVLGSQLSRHSNWSQHSTGDSLSGDLHQRLTITEDTPAGEDEKHLEVHDSAKQALLTMLDSDRIEILEQPKDLEVSLHQKAMFRCRARARDVEPARMEGVKQQWYRGEEVLEGESSAELVFVRVEKQHIGLYFCVLTHPDDNSIKKCSYVAQLSVRTGGGASRGGPSGGGTLDPAAVKLKAPEPKAPVIVQQPPQKMVAVIGEDLILPLKVKGEPPISYKWYKDSSELNHAHEAVLVIPRASYTDSGQYCCSVSNLHGSQLSRSSHIQVSRVKPHKEDRLSGQKQRPQSLHNWEGSVISDTFLREVASVVAQQVSNWHKLVSYLGLTHSDLVEVKSSSHQPLERAVLLLCRWRERYSETRELLRTRLQRAGLNLEVLMSMPGGQVRVAESKAVAKPSFAVQPQSKEVVYGQEFSLSVVVESPLEQLFSLQWYKNYACLHGKTEPKLTIKSAVDSDAGEYHCVAVNKGGSVDSDIAFVTIINPHAVRHHHVSEHQVPMLSSWVGQGSYPWPQSGGRPGARRYYSSEELIGRGYLDEGGELGRSGFNSLMYSSRSDPVMEKPRIVKQPESQAVEAGDPLTLTCEAVGEGKLEYLWYFNGLSLQRETQPEYFIHCFTDEDEGDYYCRVSNPSGEVNTDIAHVTMKDD